MLRRPAPERVAGRRSTDPFSALRPRPRPWAGSVDAYGCCARRERNGHARRRPWVGAGGHFELRYELRYKVGALFSPPHINCMGGWRTLIFD